MDIRKATKILNDKYDFSQLLSSHDLGSCAELTVNRYGDVITFRVYENGEITAR